MTSTIRIGSRGSLLSLWQANYIKELIQKNFPGQKVEIEVFVTTGDRILDRPLAMIGGKGLFVTEVESALLEGAVDIAVHSMKDMPGKLPEGLMIGAVPLRENPMDVLVCINRDQGMEQYPAGAKIGTSSLRRTAQIRHLRPDLDIVPIRGNLDTRLAKLDTGQFYAIVVAAAGMKRLDKEDRISQYLLPEHMLPAVGQGALCVEVRKENTESLDAVIQSLNHEPSRICVAGERAFLREIEGSCHIPVAGYAQIAENGQVHITGLVASLDGKNIVKGDIMASAADVETAGAELAHALLARGGKSILEEINAQGF